MTTTTPDSQFHTRLFINGQFVPAHDGQTFEVMNPATGRLIAHVSSANDADVDAAVNAAHAAFPAWAALAGAERGRVLHRFADLIERDADHIARIESTDNGKMFGMARFADVANLIDTFRYYAGWADKLEGRSIPTGGAFGRPTLSYTIREPLGVIAGIGAYNAPTMYVGWKNAAALAAGNTVVFKSAEEAPLSAVYLATLVAEAGFPPGVFNIITGPGPVTGMALVRHRLVAKISYTGGGAVGRIIAKAAAEMLKPITLELGGKAPQIVLEGANLEKTIPVLAMGLFANQGQICAAGTRVLVHRSRHAEVAEALGDAARAQVLGDPLDPTATMGPLTTVRSVDRIMGYVETGKQEGAKLIAGGTRGDRPGYFVNPTIFSGDNRMRIAQEEIFGPVGTIIPFDTPEEAVRLANETPYGLNAGIFTDDLSQAHVLARELKTGAVWINGFGLIDPRLPWGGVKESGYGRENSSNGLDDVTHEKVVTVLL